MFFVDALESLQNYKFTKLQADSQAKRPAIGGPF
jgi:hypothetical protein